MTRSTYEKGTFNAICDLCGFEFKRSEMRLNWKNQLVCGTDYEEKHPQLTLRPRTDRQSVRDARPPQQDPGLADPPISRTNTSGLV